MSQDDKPFYQLGAKYDFGWSEDHSNQVARLSKQLYEGLVGVGLLGQSSEKDLTLLEDAGYVHDIGRSDRSIGSGGHNERSEAQLKEALRDIPCSQEHARILLYCVRHHTGESWRDASAGGEVPPALLDHAKKLCGIFRIADALDRGLRNRVKRVSLGLDGSTLVCRVFPVTPSARDAIEAEELQSADKKSDLLRETFELKEVRFGVSGND